MQIKNNTLKTIAGKFFIEPFGHGEVVYVGSGEVRHLPSPRRSKYVLLGRITVVQKPEEADYNKSLIFLNEESQPSVFDRASLTGKSNLREGLILWYEP